MNIILNNIPTPLPNDYMTLKELMEWKNVNPAGTAVAVNGRIVKRENWGITYISEMDHITVISAAFGG